MPWSICVKNSAISKILRVYIVIQIVYNNVATEITLLKIQPPPDGKVSFQLLKTSPQSQFFFHPPPPPPSPSLLLPGGAGGRGGCILWLLSHKIRPSQIASNGVTCTQKFVHGIASSVYKKFEFANLPHKTIMLWKNKNKHYHSIFNFQHSSPKFLQP